MTLWQYRKALRLQRSIIGPIIRYKCNDRPFYVVILEGYSVAGVYIVVMVRSRRMLDCLGNLVLCQVPATTVAGQATTRVKLSVCLGRS